jgi:ribosome modulation factor
MITVLSFTIAGALLALSTALFIFEARRMMRLARAYAQGYEDAHLLAGDLGAQEHRTEDERTEYLHGRRDGWKDRVAELSKRRAA